jgi:hypothetical protein
MVVRRLRTFESWLANPLSLNRAGSVAQPKFYTMSKKKKSRDPEPMDDGGDYGMYEQKVVIQEDPIHGQLELTDKELETDVS